MDILINISKGNNSLIIMVLSKIDEVTLGEDVSVKITSVGSGPSIEVREYFKKNDANGKAKFCLVDMEKEAISFSKNKLSNNDNIVFHVKNIRELIVKDNAKIFIGEQNFIYSSGLYDYFSIKASKRFTKALWKIVKSGGRLLIANAHPACPTRFWMEWDIRWSAYYT